MDQTVKPKEIEFVRTITHQTATHRTSLIRHQMKNKLLLCAFALLWHPPHLHKKTGKNRRRSKGTTKFQRLGGGEAINNYIAWAAATVQKRL